MLWVSACFAQTPHPSARYRAVHWDIQDGLNEAKSYYLLKDIKGFLWTATTNGVSRFDGHTFKQFFSGKDKNKTLVGNYILGLHEDSLHNIWIGTTNGLSRYDILSDTFTNMLPKMDSGGQHRDDLIPFWATKDEMFCFENDWEMVAIDIHSFKRRLIAKLKNTNNLFPGLSASYSVFDSATKDIWVLEDVSPENPSGGLRRVSLSDGKEEDYGWSCFLGIPNHNHTAEAMKLDRKRNSIWINSPDGLVEFTLKDRQFHPVEALHDIVRLKNYSRYVGIDIDVAGKVWIVTAPKGIIIYDPKNQSVSFPFDTDSAQQKTANANAVLYCDRDNIVWTGSWLNLGMYQIFPYSPVVKHYVTNPADIHSLEEDFVFFPVMDKNNTLWVTTIHGSINTFNTETEEFTRLSSKELPGKSKDDNNIFAVCSISIPGNVAVVMNNKGPYAVDLSTKKSRDIVYHDTLGHVVAPRTGLDYIPRAFRNGVTIILDYNKRTEVYYVDADSAAAFEIASVPADEIDNIVSVPVSDHLMFLKKANPKKINRSYDYTGGKWKLIPTPIDSLDWSNIMYNKSDDSYWVAAVDELIHYKNDFSVIRRYTLQDGYTNFPVTALIVDDQNNIWFHTDRSIHQLDVKTGVFSTLTEADGFEPQPFELLPFATKDRQGNIYYTGGFFGRGMNRISPQKFASFPGSLVYLRTINVNHRPFNISTGFNSVGELSLSHSQNNISIETGIVDYYSKGNSRVRYKLENPKQDAAWQYGPYYSTINYEDLRPGDYKLIIQASNVDNIFNGPEKILYIHISAPFWTTWWFILLTGVCTIGLIYWWIQYRSRQLRERNNELETKILVRTKELKHSLEELRDTQTQLIHREKMASLGELTAGVAHEIQNPLNFINNFSELNSELIDDMKTEIDNGNLSDVKQLADNIQSNEQKINHHGKRADSIVKSMLEHSRISGGQKEPADLNALAEEFLRLSYHGLRAKDKSFQASYKTAFDDTLGKISIVPQDIGRVLLNLYNNAFDSVAERKKNPPPDYQPEVLVTTQKLDNLVLITIRDNGSGIPENIINKIFQPFFTTKSPGQGTGLGLSISYDVIRAHGGEIKVNSKENEGTEFVITLPLA